MGRASLIMALGGVGLLGLLARRRAKRVAEADEALAWLVAMSAVGVEAMRRKP